jgi:hypothetical protein
MYHPRHAGPHRFLIPLAVAALVAVVAGLAFGINGRPDAAEPPRQPDRQAGAHEGTGPDDGASESAVAAASEGPGALDRCRMQYDGQSPVLRTAARSIKQWQVHVEAMNQLVAGEITLDQASAFWNRTRVGAKGRVADFRKADHAYAALSHDCPSPPASDAELATTCARSVGLRGKVVRVARRSIDTWAKHVRDMELLRDGKLSPTEAMEMWQMSWRMGQRQIDAYQDALRRADRADRGACTT